MNKELNIIEITKYKNFEFKMIYKDGSKRKYNVYIDSNSNLFDTLDGNLLCTTEAVLTAKFIPASKPVSFMEAIKAYSEGKTIKCYYEETTGVKQRSIYEHGKMDEGIKDETRCSISPAEILRGTWYIED